MSRVNEHGQLVGDPVEYGGAHRPEPVVLAGHAARLEPAGTHVHALYDAVCGPGDDPLWTYLRQDRPGSVAELDAHLRSGVAAGDLCLAILDEQGPAGFSSLMRVDLVNGSVEVGGICLSRRLQRTRAATEAMYLLARHVFEDLGFRRYEWKCDSLNTPSRRAAVRLGFTEEGTFRQALVLKGRNRDTTWFSLTDREWPRVRDALEAWLEPGNFDDHGRQRRSLAEPRA